MRRQDPLLYVILWWTVLVAGVLVWLPLVRGATQGTAYRWELVHGIGGRGVGGAHGLLLLGLVYVLTLLYLGWRGARHPFHALLLAFHVPLAIAVARVARTDPQGFRFQGATAGLDVPLAVIGPVLFGGFALAAIVWVVRDFRARRSREGTPWAWNRATLVRLALVFALVPLEVVLFRSGGIESVQNLIGVGLVGWQWVMVNRILAGARASNAPESVGQQRTNR